MFKHLLSAGMQTRNMSPQIRHVWQTSMCLRACPFHCDMAISLWSCHCEMANYHDMAILLTPVHPLVILLHSHPPIFSDSRPLVLSSSRPLVLSSSRPLVLSSSRPPAF